MAQQSGLAKKLYRASAVLADAQDATIAAATWNELTYAENVEVTKSWDTADVTRRGTNPNTANLPTRRKIEFAFDLFVDLADTASGGSKDDYVAIADAHKNGTEIALAEMNAAIATSGSRGAVANCIITQMREMGRSSDAWKFSCTAIIGPSGVGTPEYVKT